MQKQAAAEAATQAFLHAHGLRVQHETLEALVAAAVSRLQRALYRPDPRTELTAAEARVLREGGFPLEEKDLGAEDPLVKTAVEYAALLRTSLSPEQAATQLGTDVAQVLSWITDSPPRLYGVRLGSGWYLPAFQFEGDHVVPGLPEVIGRLDSELHPLSVYNWLTLPSPDLEVDESLPPLSPLEWLRQGLPVEPVAQIASFL